MVLANRGPAFFLKVQEKNQKPFVDNGSEYTQRLIITLAVQHPFQAMIEIQQGSYSKPLLTAIQI